MIFVDSDVMIDVLRKHPPAIAWMRTIGAETLAMSGFVAMELIQGCKNKTEQQRVEKHLKNIRLVWPSEVTCEAAFTTFSKHYLSHNIGILDAVIGHTAVDLAIPLCTFNAKHYAVVPNLTCTIPYQR